MDAHNADLAGDMARRVARRREELGLTLEELAGKTGIDPGYLRYFENHADARLSAGSTLLLAQPSRPRRRPCGTGRVANGTWACGTSPTAPDAHARAV